MGKSFFSIFCITFVVGANVALCTHSPQGSVESTTGRQPTTKTLATNQNNNNDYDTQSNSPEYISYLNTPSEDDHSSVGDNGERLNDQFDGFGIDGTDNDDLNQNKVEPIEYEPNLQTEQIREDGEVMLDAINGGFDMEDIEQTAINELIYKQPVESVKEYIDRLRIQQGKWSIPLEELYKYKELILVYGSLNLNLVDCSANGLNSINNNLAYHDGYNDLLLQYMSKLFLERIKLKDQILKHCFIQYNLVINAILENDLKIRQNYLSIKDWSDTIVYQLKNVYGTKTSQVIAGVNRIVFGTMTPDVVLDAKKNNELASIIDLIQNSACPKLNHTTFNEIFYILDNILINKMRWKHLLPADSAIQEFTSLVDAEGVNAIKLYLLYQTCIRNQSNEPTSSSPSVNIT